MPKTNLHQHIFIDALPSKVWKVLTSCHYVNQYLLEGTVLCQWTEGSTITLITQNEETIHKGNIVQVVPGVLLTYKLHEEATNNFIRIGYELIPAEDGIELKFYSDNFIDTDENYFLRIKDTKLLLQKIKWLAEYA